MSAVPAWKQAILQRRRQQEEEQRKKEAESEAYLASLPPWKRALVLRRQKEKKEKEETAATATAKPERSDSFSKWEEKQRNQAADRKLSWVRTPSTSTPTTSGSSSVRTVSNPTTSPRLASTSPAHRFSGPQTHERPTPRRESVTVLPAVSDPIVIKKTDHDSTPPSKGVVVLRNKDAESDKRSTSVRTKRKSFEEDDPKFKDMPAWKKALLIRRRASQSEHQTKPDSQEENNGPQKPNLPQASMHFEAASEPLLPGSEDERLPESPVSSVRPSPAIIKTINTDKEVAPLAPAPKAVSSKVAPMRPAPSCSAPSRPAPSKPSPALKSSSEPKPSPATSRKQSAPTVMPSSQPSKLTKAPEVVNRRTSETTQPNRLVEQEGVTLHAPIFKEVPQWANVSEEDPKFTNLPQWKQALIRRRRADIAKRTGTNTTSVSPPRSPTEMAHDDIPSASKEDSRKSPPIPAWKQDLMKRKNSGSQSNMNREERRLTGNNRGTAQPSQVTSGNVKALLGKFNEGGTFQATSPPRTANFIHQAPKSWGQAPKATVVPQATSIPHPIPEEVLSDGSEEDLEDITLTNIDELSTDEEDDDDSGIGKGRSSSHGASISLLSPPVFSTTSTSRPRREKSRSILSNPVRKVYRVSVAIYSHAQTLLRGNLGYHLCSCQLGWKALAVLVLTYRSMQYSMLKLTQPINPVSSVTYRIVENFRGRKTFANWQKICAANGCHTPKLCQKLANSHKTSKFAKIFCYTVMCKCCCCGQI